MEGAGDGPRGRARSRSYSSNDSMFTAELYAVTGGTVIAPPLSTSQSDMGSGSGSSSNSSSSSSGGSGDKQRPAGGLSAKTIQIMTKLDARLPGARGGGGGGGGGDDEDDDGEGGGGGSGGELGDTSTSLLDEEAEAEAELARQEAASRRSSKSTNAGGGGGGGGDVGGNSDGVNGSGSNSGASTYGGSRRGTRDDREYDVSVKLLMLGDAGVGKTSLMLRFSENKFAANTLSTAGVDFKTAFLDIEGKKVKCQIWDTAGQQRFHVITHSYYKNAQGIVLIYDASDTTEER